MDASQFETCLGKAEDSADVRGMLTALGITQKLEPSSEGYLRLTLAGQGLLLSFVPGVSADGKLVFTGVQFYSDSEEGFTTFAGALPGGLTFADSPAQARAKLGKPTEIMKEFRIDHWIADGRQLTVRYTKSRDGIAHVLRGFPRKDRK